MCRTEAEDSRIKWQQLGRGYVLYTGSCAVFLEHMTNSSQANWVRFCSLSSIILTKQSTWAHKINFYWCSNTFSNLTFLLIKYSMTMRFPKFIKHLISKLQNYRIQNTFCQGTEKWPQVMWWGVVCAHMGFAGLVT